VLQFAAVCCSMLRRVAVCCGVCDVLRCVAVCRSVLQCNASSMQHDVLKFSKFSSIASFYGQIGSELYCEKFSQVFEHAQKTVLPVLVCGSVWECVGVCGSVWQCVGVCGNVWRCVAVCGSVWQCVAVCCSALQCVSELQCVAMCCSV